MPAYRLELASTGRALCNGKKPCFKTKIDKGQLRLGVWVEIPGRGGSFKWRHWGCVTPEVIKHWKEDFSEAEELDGYEDLSEDLQQKVKNAWAEGHVRPEDVPESAKVEKVEEGAEDAEGAEAEPKAKKPAAKKGGKKAKKDEGEDGEDAEEAAPKKRKAPVKKSKKEEPNDEDVEDDAEEEEVPKKKRKAPAKKSAKAAKEEAEKEDDAKATEEVGEKPKSKGRGRPKKDTA